MGLLNRKKIYQLLNYISQQGGHEFGKHEMQLHNCVNYERRLVVKICLRVHVLLTPATLLLLALAVIIGG
jgi:hypothetical protein